MIVMYFFMLHTQTCQVSNPNLEIVQSLEVLKDLFIQTQSNITSILPLDLKDSVYIVSVVSNLLARNIHRNGRIQDTFVSNFSVVLNRLYVPDFC